MTAGSSPQVTPAVEDPDATTRIGGWLFRQRTLIPLPLAAAVLLIPARANRWSAALVWGGVVVTAAGESLRLWAVHHIGAISRTRSERLGPLIDTGPFARLRNPLYIGNIALWSGFALTAGLVWLAFVIVALLAVEYHAIVRWEERLLASRMGEPYRDYLNRVPRWKPTLTRRAREDRGLDRIPASTTIATEHYSWRETMFSERGTLIAMALGYVLLWLKARF